MKNKGIISVDASFELKIEGCEKNGEIKKESYKLTLKDRNEWKREENMESWAMDDVDGWFRLV